MMGPFDITQWSDYVRGLVGETTRARMEEQLQRDPAARRTVDALRRVAQVAAEDRRLEVPANVLRSVYALGSQLKKAGSPESFWDGLSRFVMSLTFDSAMAPAMVGVRDAQQASHRQLFYELDDVAVELRHEPHSSGDVVVGQLMRLGDDAQPLAGVEVLAKSGERVIARTTTGPLGEFQADQLPAQDLVLFFVLEDRCLEVSLPASDR